MKKVFFIIIVFFCFGCSVFADSELDCDELEINKINSCGNQGTTVGTCDFKISNKLFPSGKTSDTREVFKEGTGDRVEPGDCRTSGKYDVVVLLDDSGSMLDNINGDRVEKVRETLWRLVKVLKERYPQSKLTVHFFRGTTLVRGERIMDITREILSEKVNRDKYTVKGSGTNFSKPLKWATNHFSNSSSGYMPLVVFITDGYPNAYDTADEGGSKNHNLGYVSSARFFYKATVRLKNLAKVVNNVDGGKIVTISVDITSEDTMAKYFLQPTKKNYDNLSDGSNANDESKRYKKMISGSKTKFKEVVASIRGKPDLGIVGWSKIGTKSVTFSNLKALSNNKYSMTKASNDGLIIGPVNCNAYNYRARLCVGNHCKKASSTSGSYGSSSAYNGKCFMRFNMSSSDAETFSRAENWVLRSNNSLSFLNYNGDGKKLNMHYNNNNKTKTVFKTYNSPDEVQTKDWEEIVGNCPDKIIHGTEDRCEPVPYSVDNYKYNGGICVEKYYFIPNVIYKGQSYSAQVPYLLLEDTSFVGLNGLSEDGYYAGAGFPMKNILVQRAYKIEFAEIAADQPVVNLLSKPDVDNDSSSDEVVFEDTDNNDVLEDDNDFSDGISDGSVSESVDDDGIYKRVKLSEISISIDKLKNDIMNGNNAIISSKKNLEKIEAIDSNNSKTKKDITNDLSEESIGQYGSSYRIKNAYYNSAAGTYGKFLYNDSQPDDYILMDEEKPNHYYIPYGYSNNKFDVNFLINSRINSKKFNAVCSVNVQTTGNPQKQLNYRAIDVNNPFPKSGYVKSKIPFNWRDWYCLNSNGGNCTNNNSNKIRLENSYSDNYKHYWIDLKDANLNNYILNRSYRSFEGIDIFSGKSNYVSSNFEHSVNDNYYCKYGEFESGCDKYSK